MRTIERKIQDKIETFCLLFVEGVVFGNVHSHLGPMLTKMIKIVKENWKM